MISKNVKTKLIFILSILIVLCSIAFGMAGNNTALATTDVESFKMNSGAQVRVDDQRAIRFTTSILKTDLEEIKGESNDVAVVTMILPTDTLGSREFVAEDNIEVDAENGVKMKSIVFSDKFETPNLTTIEAVWNETQGDWTIKTDGTGTHYIFRACLYDIKPENTVRDFSARSYIAVNGEVYDYTDYSETNNSRNIWDVANSYLGSYDVGSEEYANLSAIASTNEVTITSGYDATKSVTIDVKNGDCLSNYLDQLTEVTASDVGVAYFDCMIDSESQELDLDTPIITPLVLTAKYSTITYGYDAQKDIEGATGCYYVADNKSFTGDTVIIPEKYDDGINGEKYVKYVANDAFNDNKNVQKVILPETLKVIGGSAFKKCTSLKYIEMPGVEDISSPSATWFASRYSIYANAWQTYDTFKNAPIETIILGEAFNVQENQFLCDNVSGITRVYSKRTTTVEWGDGDKTPYGLYLGSNPMFITTCEDSIKSPIYFYSEEIPTDKSYTFWRYVDGVPKIWEEYAE